MKKFLIFILLVNLVGIVSAQTVNKLPTETVHFHSDRDVYLAGENIWFSAKYVVNPTGIAPISTVLYVELHDHEGNAFVRKKYAIQQSHSEGVLTIPDKLPSGTYYLRAYTQYQQNLSSEALTYVSVTIIQPEKPLPHLKASVKQPAIQKKSPTSITLTTDKPEYGQRESVLFRIFNDFPSDQLPLNLSVAVVKKGTMMKDRPDLDGYFATSNIVKEVSYIPEIRSVSVSGKIVNKESGKGEKGVTCWISVMGESGQVHTMRTDSLGRFLFALNEIYGSHQLFLGIDHPNKESMEWQINQDFSSEFPELPQIPLRMDSTDQRLLEKLYISRQVNEQFPYEEFDSKKEIDSLPFNIIKPVYSRQLEDFVEIPKLEEVFNEFIPAVSVRRKKGNPYLTVWDEEGQISYLNPLILLDNIPIFDVAALINLSPGDIKSIGVTDRPYTLGAYTFGGVIQLTTETDNLGGIQLPKSSVFLTFEGLSESQRFSQKFYKERELNKNNLPDFRNTLYWNPSVNITSSPHSITFFTSDQVGSYEVWVRGITKAGKIIQDHSQFEIVRKSKGSK